MLVAPWASFLAVALPLGYLVTMAITAADEEVSLSRWLELPRTFRSLKLLAGVLAVDLPLAIFLAWLTTRTNLIGRRLFTILAICPLAVPAYISAYAFLSLGGDNGVLVTLLGRDSWLLSTMFAEDASGQPHVPRISGYWGAVAALAAYNVPYLFLPVRAVLRQLDPALEDASYSLGQNRWQTWWKVVLPQLRPAVLAGTLIVALHVVSDFGVVSLMRYDTLSAAIYTRFLTFDLAGAARLALLIVTLAILLVSGEMYLLRNVRLDRSAFGSPRAASPQRLGAWQLPAIGVCLIVFGLCTILPAATSVYWMTRLWRIEAEVDILPALLGSLQGSVPAALIAAAWAVPLAWLSVRYTSRLGNILQRLPVIGYAVPALAFGLSLIILCSADWVPDLIYHALYQSLPLLVFAYAVHFLAEAVGPVRSSLMLASPRLEETSRALGRGKIYTLFWVTLPLLRHGLVVAAVLVFLSCMKELPLTMLLAPGDMETLARAAWDHTENAQFAQAAPYALTILATSTLLVSLLLWERKRADQ